MTAKIIENPTYRERMFVFRDRLHAGKLLAEKLREYAGKGNVILLALPAGGVPVGYAIAKELGILMDTMVVRKVQMPWNTEAGFGALTWDGETVLNEPLLRQLCLTREVIKESNSKTRRIIQERLRKFRGNKPMPDLSSKVVILVDDGLASGFTMLAAARSARKRTPEKIIVAVPTASMGAIKLLTPEVDEIVCLNIRSASLFAVADAYKNWYDLTDEEVTKILERAEKLRDSLVLARSC
jgi:predicted phosphoribosyltransferase